MGEGIMDEKQIIKIVLDDDPTGSQTVHGVPVLTDWTSEAIGREMRSGTNLFYILTNSRALTQGETEALHREIVANIQAASDQNGKCSFEIISRSDSTLRGHYPLEIDVLKNALAQYGTTLQGEILIPFFKEGGRVTVNGVHYCEMEGGRRPASETEYAKDPTFGYKSSFLPEWVEEKTKGRVDKAAVVVITLEDLRLGGAERVFDILMQHSTYTVFAVDGEEDSDIEIFVRGLSLTQGTGKRYIYRTAASFVRIYGNISKAPLLERSDFDLQQGNGLLLVAGSFVVKTSRQLETLFARYPEGLRKLELNVQRVAEGRAGEEIERISAEAEEGLRCGECVVIYTSRRLYRASEAVDEINLSFSKKVSRALVKIVHSLSTRPKAVIAKGGITSSDIAVQGLSIHRAMVMGQLLPGIPVWQTGAESKWPHIPYVICPGNVGSDEALFQIVETLN